MSETTHRGVRWRRTDGGDISFWDHSAKRWVKVGPGVDAPPLPPRWQILGVPTKAERPGWRSPARLGAIALVVVAVIIAILQSVLPSSSNTSKEAKASAALLGKCLAQDGTSAGHPRYSATPVDCGSPHAAVKVEEVIPSTPGSPLCPSGTTGVELPYAGVRYLHIECLRPVHAG